MARLRLHRSEVEHDLLPAVCMCCGEPAAVRKTKGFAWDQPGVVSALLIVGLCIWPLLLLGLLIAMATTHRLQVRVPLCQAHRNYWQSRARFTYGGLAAFLGLGVLLVLAWSVGPKVSPPAWRGALADMLPLLALGTLLAGLVWLVTAAILQQQSIRATEITAHGITLIHVSPRFVQALRAQTDLDELGPIRREDWSPAELAGEPSPSPGSAEKPPREEGLQAQPGPVAPPPAWERAEAPTWTPRRPRRPLVKETPVGLVVGGVLAVVFLVCAGGATLVWWASPGPPPPVAVQGRSGMPPNNAPMGPNPNAPPPGVFPPVAVLPPPPPDPHEIRRFEGHTGCAHAVAFAPDGRRALTGSCDNTARLWDVETGRELQRFQGFQGQVNGVAIAPKGRLALTVAHDSRVQLWDLRTGREVRRFNGHQGAVHGVCFAADGRTALTAGEDQAIRHWDVETGREIRRLTGHIGAVLSVAISPDGHRALSGGMDHTVRLWDLTTGKELRRFQGHTNKVTSVCFSPDGRWAASGSGRTVRSDNLMPIDPVARLWNVETGQEVRRFEGHTDGVACVAFSPDGHRLLTGSADNSVRLWQVESGRELLRLQGHTNWVFAVQFSPDGRRALSGGADQTVRLWHCEVVLPGPAP
jgi:sugar lactone lactonase YvrE